MKLYSVILGIILIEVATRRCVTGLQCYVCEDCNEYEDFKELHICGEIPIEVTTNPFTQPQTLEGGSTTRKPFKRTSVATSSKPTEKTTIDDYLYEDSDEKHNAQQGSNQKNVTRKDSTQTSTTSGATTITARQKLSTQTPTTLTAKLTKTTTQSLVINSGTTVVTKVPNTENKPSTSTAAVTTAKPLLPDYDDYLEYEDPLKVPRSEVTSLLKVNQPVCYMIKYHANNTIITNRGCTTFINANKYLTCQTLYNGDPMESCRVCSSNGCNKFLDDDINNYDDILFNAAAAHQHFGICLLLLWIIFSRAII